MQSHHARRDELLPGRGDYKPAHLLHLRSVCLDDGAWIDTLIPSQYFWASIENALVNHLSILHE